MKHYIITRFNVKEPFWDPAPGWLEARKPLWQKTVRSVRAAEGDFTWLVLVHHKTPPPIIQYLNSFSDFQILWVGDNWQASLRNWLNKQNDPAIITTRLDSDDLIAPEYPRLIEEAYDPTLGFYFLDAPLGYQLCDSRWYLLREECNPFCSLVETRGDYQTVYCTPHGASMRKWIVRQIPGRQWVQVIHNRNAKNILKGQRVKRGPAWM